VVTNNTSTRQRIRQKRSFYNLRQANAMSCQEYLEKVRSIIEVIKSLGGSLCDEMHLREELPPRANVVYTDQEIRQAKERIHLCTTC